MERGEFRPVEKFEYKNFDSEEERRDVFKYCKALSEYIKNENIKNVIFPDTSARPAYVGVQEYFAKKDPEARKDFDIYFINPNGMEGEKVFSFFGMFYTNEWHDGMSKEEFTKKFAETYKQLLSHQDKPTLVFDTCIHTGRTMSKLKTALESTGFTDVRLGSVSKPNDDSEQQADFVVTEGDLQATCYPFGRERMVRSRNDDVSSERVTNISDIKTGQELREEIKHIMDSYLDK